MASISYTYNRDRVLNCVADTKRRYYWILGWYLRPLSCHGYGHCHLINNAAHLAFGQLVYSCPFTRVTLTGKLVEDKARVIQQCYPFQTVSIATVIQIPIELSTDFKHKLETNSNYNSGHFNSLQILVPTGMQPVGSISTPTEWQITTVKTNSRPERDWQNGYQPQELNSFQY